MTIRVEVKNLDTRKTAVISVVRRDEKGEDIPGLPPKELKGGESCEEYVHGGQSLFVQEIKNG